MPTTLERKSALTWLGLAVLTLTMTLWAVFRFQPAEPAETVEALREALVLRDERLHLGDASEPFTGSMIERYEDGALKSRTSVVKGLLEGVSEGWHPNGQLQVREHFKVNVSHGPRLKWYEDGTVMSESTIENGEHNGVFRRWHQSGQLAEQVNLVQGKANGLSYSFFPSGYLQARVRLGMGEVVEQRFWEDGERRLEDVEELP